MFITLPDLRRGRVGTSEMDRHSGGPSRLFSQDICRSHGESSSVINASEELALAPFTGFLPGGICGSSKTQQEM